MRDHGSRWPAVPYWATFDLARADLRVAVVQPAAQAWVSGDLDAFRRASGLEEPAVGGFGRAGGDAYAVRVARDRLLAVGVAGAATAPGWHAEGFAVTPIDAGLLVFAFGGPGLDGLAARATHLIEADRSPSAATVFAGLPALVYRHGDDLMVHVERGLAPTLAAWLRDLPPAL